MKYSIDQKLRNRGEIYTINSGLMRTLNNRQTRLAACILLIATIAAAGVIARGILMPDSSFIISGEQKPQSGQVGATEDPDPAESLVTDTYIAPMSESSVSGGGFKPYAVQIPVQGQLQAPSTATVTQPVTNNTGGMGGGVPQVPDTDCGCVDRAVDKATGTVAESVAPIPGF